MLEIILIVMAIFTGVRLIKKHQRTYAQYRHMFIREDFEKWNTMDTTADMLFIAGVAVGVIAANIVVILEFLGIQTVGPLGESSGLITPILCLIIPIIPSAILGTMAAHFKNRTSY